MELMSDEPHAADSLAPASPKSLLVRLAAGTITVTSPASNSDTWVVTLY